MVGGRGNDVYRVDDAKDRVVEHAGEGIDLVTAAVSHVLARNVENLTLTGNATRATGNNLANVLTGTAGDNVLDGRAGDDVLSGGAGRDWLYGREGADVFAFSNRVHSLPGAASDVIADFEAGIDTIGLAALGDKVKGSLSFIGDDAFSGTRGEVRYDNHVVAIDMNGDSISDFEIHMKGHVVLSADDFNF